MMRSYLWIYLCFSLIVSLFDNPIAYAKEQPKFALFIANEKYEDGNVLLNPVNDAKRVADSLRKAGFTSFIYTDLAYANDMKNVVDRFLNLVEEQDKTGNAVVWVYYAGHGEQKDGNSNLISTKGESLPAQKIMNGLYQRGKNKKDSINIIVLDTCRPIQSNVADELSGDLVRVGGGNVMVVFSTKAGESAADGKIGENSPFARALIDGINRWHWQSLEEVLQAVGKGVRESNSEKQQVYVYGWVGVPFCLSNCLGSQNVTITP